MAGEGFERARTNDVNELTVRAGVGKSTLTPARNYGEENLRRDRENEIERVAKKWYRERVEHRNSGALSIMMVLAGIGIIMVIGGILWSASIADQASNGKITSLDEIMDTFDQVKTATYLEWIGLLLAIVGMFLSILIIARAVGYRFDLFE